jgi:hypothetical protein
MRTQRRRETTERIGGRDRALSTPAPFYLRYALAQPDMKVQLPIFCVLEPIRSGKSGALRPYLCSRFRSIVEGWMYPVLCSQVAPSMAITSAP